jgi:lipopolysaccharide transport system ATP-binding protein
MSQPVISVSGLGKHYRLTHQVRADTLRDTVMHSARTLARRILGHTEVTATEEFWALRDVGFEVRQGEVLGIIGRNGAGKSTLLKILSRITEPTTGSVRLRGRVASLLEVGTGFHPELTGRENIFLNGAILGMSRLEIRRKFDEIVAFAEVERFLDTPVKHYSSGMYVRLAFAVAAHLEPEILIIDEVLAVGDLAFQKKCLGKMESVSHQEGRTVLFVSHNLPTVRQLCQSALLLANGRVAAFGPTAPVLEQYALGLDGAEPTRIPLPSPDLLKQCYVTRAAIETMAGETTRSLPVGQPWRIRVGFRLARAGDHFVIAVGLVAADGTAVQTAWHPPQSLPAGEYEAVFEQDRVMLEAGHYVVMVGLSLKDQSIQHINATTIDLTGEGASGYYPRTAGVGTVLNSMHTTLSRVT